MIQRILVLGALGIAITSAQSPGPKPTAAKWTPPKTSWGEPDLQGMWPLNHLISVPMERPKQYGDRRNMTEDEFAIVACTSLSSSKNRSRRAALPRPSTPTPSTGSGGNSSTMR